MNTLFLIGFQGAGKSTVGRIVAEKRREGFIDTDELLLEQTGFQSVRELYQSVGEEAFRKLELQVLSTLRPADSSVIALGGGTLVHTGCQELVRGLGSTMYLFLPLNRLRHDPQALFLRGKSMHEFFEERDALYTRCADIRLDISGLSPDSVAEHIERKLYGK